jgi:hypothetical protein
VTGAAYTAYVERICPLPPLVAQAAYDEVLATPVVGAGWQLRLTGPPNGAIEGVMRRRSGLLTFGWPWRAAVELELNPWSQTRVTVGLRPCGRDVPPMWAALYFATAHEAVDQVAERLHRWADEPLRTTVAA